MKKETDFPGQSSKGFQQSFGVTLIGGAGIDGQVSKSFFIKLEWRYDLLAHLPIIGISYRIK